MANGQRNETSETDTKGNAKTNGGVKKENKEKNYVYWTNIIEW